MDLFSITKLPLSTEDGWSDLARDRARIEDVFGSLVLPSALLPPAVLYFAGAQGLGTMGQATQQTDWFSVAALFFLAELAAFVARGWLIKEVAATYAFSIDYHRAYLLAAVSPVPVQLASLGLFVPDLMVSAVIFLLGLGVSCELLYHGVQALGRKRDDEVVAARIVLVVISADLICWALVFALVIV